MADFSAVRKEECRESKLPNGCELNSSHTVVLQSVINEIKEHGRSSMHAEVCGVLVGSLCWDGGPYLLIDGRIEGKHASHQSGSVTFTSETWDFIHEELATKYPDRKIVGWYHTHPGFGIFLSNMDAFIHENFFSFPWEPAYVFDPQAETDGFFFKVGTELVEEDVCVFADVPPSVKEPPAAFASMDKIVVNDSHRRNYVLFAGLAAVFVCCLAVAVVISMAKVRETEQKVKTAETQADALRVALTDRDGVLAAKDREIKQQQLAAKEWCVRKETYEKEIAGLQVKVTAVTAERKKLEESNKERQDEVARLKSKRDDLERAVRKRELQISERNGEMERIKKDLAATREQKRQLELRIQELERSAQLKEVEPHDAAGEEDRHWYSSLMFWN